MNLNSSCNNLDAYLSDDLSGNECATFESHLEECATCRDAVTQQNWIDDLLQSPERIQLERPSATVLDAFRISVVRRRRRVMQAACGLAAAATLLIAVGLVKLNRQANEPLKSEGTTVAVAEPVRAKSCTIAGHVFQLVRRHRSAAGKPVDRCHDRASLSHHRRRTPLAPRTIFFKRIDRTKRRLMMNTLCRTNCCRCLHTFLRKTCFIASAALLSLNCGPAAAQAQPSINSQPTVESRKASPNNLGDPHSAENLAKEMLKLKDRLLQLSQGEQNETTNAEIASLVEAIAIAGAQAQPMQPTGKKTEQVAQAQQLQQLKDELTQQKRFLAEREKQYATVLAEQRRPPLPPLDNGALKVFRLLNINARDGAQMAESLFGTQSLRVAVDERSNSLLVYGKPDVLTTIDALLVRLDEQASPNRTEKKTTGRPTPRSLMLRVFWLADSVPETVGQNPAEFLPKSVLDATHKLGLEAPRLVTQTVNSLATGNDDTVDFSSNVPALLMDQPVGMSCEGKLKWVADDRVRLDMAVHVGGQVDLRGSMATPLGHYMVLGTANSMIAEGGPMSGGMPGAAGMGMGRGAMGPGGGFGPAGPGVGSPEGGAAPGNAGPGGEFGAPGGMTIAPQAKQKFATSRFAFVVQVIEGQSYGAEKSKGE